VILFSGSLLLALGLGVVALGQCANDCDADVVAHDTIGLGTVVGRSLELGAAGVVWLGRAAALAGVLVLLGVFARWFKRGPAHPAPPPPDEQSFAVR